MGWPVYSERLLHMVSGNGWVYAAVPAGQRAVVKGIAATNAGVQAGVVVVEVNGVWVWRAHFLAADVAKQAELMAVAYAGETIGIYKATFDLQVGVYGFLLADPSGRRESPLHELETPNVQPAVPAGEAA